MSDCRRRKQFLEVRKDPRFYDTRRPPRYAEPLEIGCFSFDADSKFRDDDHQMKYLSLPSTMKNLSMDLNEGYDRFIPAYEDSENNYSAILKWILAHEDDVRSNFPSHSSTDPKIDFICFRGLFKAVSSTPYETFEDWLIYATKFRSVIYLDSVTTERQLKRSKNASEKEKRMISWGFKFEQCMVSDAPHLKPVTSVPVNGNEKYFSVMKGKLGEHRLLFAADVDCADPKYLTSSSRRSRSSRYAELKTSKLITTEKQKNNFNRYKLLKWHLQSFFAGIPEVICGFRDDDGIVRQLSVFKVDDMPTNAGNYWSQAVCLNFCSRVLDKIKKWVIKDDPNVVYRIYWEPGFDIVCEELDSEELDSEYRVLPKWYIDKVTVI